MAIKRGKGYFETLSMLRQAEEEYGPGAGDFDLAFQLSVIRYDKPVHKPEVRKPHV